MTRNAFQFLLLLCLALALPSSACKSEKKADSTKQLGDESKEAAEAKAEPDKDPTEEVELPADDSKYLIAPFFYSIAGPDGASGHILGSMHMGVDAKTELPPVIWKALGEASTLVIEADITDVSLSSGMMLPKGQNLRELLGEEDWKLVEEKLGAPTAKMMMTMKPAAVAATLGMKDLPITMPMELSLIMQAKEDKVELGYLETGAFQLALLNRIMDVEFLKHMLRTAKSEDTKELLNAYRQGDEDVLLALMSKPDAWGKVANAEANMEAMLYKRNDAWIPLLEELFAKKKAFVAVGAAHLVGPRGVLAQLRDKGYTVERVKP